MSGIRTEATQMVIQTNGVDGLKVKETGVCTAGAAGVSGLDLATVGQSLGWGQNWQNLTGSRVIGTNYTNSTGRPIQVNVLVVTAATTATVEIFANGALAARNMGNGTYQSHMYVSAVIPAGATYAVGIAGAPSPSLHTWTELR